MLKMALLWVSILTAPIQPKYKCGHSDGYFYTYKVEGTVLSQTETLVSIRSEFDYNGYTATF